MNNKKHLRRSYNTLKLPYQFQWFEEYFQTEKRGTKKEVVWQEERKCDGRAKTSS